MTRIKTAEAARVAGKKGFSLISDEKFRELYAALLQCRMLDQRLAAVRGYERWPGREAATAGVVACLRSGDSIIATPRGVLGRYLQHSSVCVRHAASASIAQLAAATGDGLRHRLEKLGHIAVVYTTCPHREPRPVRGDPGCGEPERMREIFAAASKQSLPVLYIVEGGTLDTDACGSIPIIRVDGSDTVAIYRVAYESITRAREGGGPTIVECVAWPFETAPADPLQMLEQYLTGKKFFRKDWKRRLEQRYGKALDAAVMAARLR